jgi:hypothetical protein
MFAMRPITLFSNFFYNYFKLLTDTKTGVKPFPVSLPGNVQVGSNGFSAKRIALPDLDFS